MLKRRTNYLPRPQPTLFGGTNNTIKETQLNCIHSPSTTTNVPHPSNSTTGQLTVWRALFGNTLVPRPPQQGRIWPQAEPCASHAAQHTNTRTATATLCYVRTVSPLLVARHDRALPGTSSGRTRRWRARGSAFRGGWPRLIVPLAAAAAATMVVMVTGWTPLLGRGRSRWRVPTCRV